MLKAGDKLREMSVDKYLLGKIIIKYMRAILTE